MDKQERIRKYAYEWYEFYKDKGWSEDSIRDWLKAEHIVSAEELVSHSSDDKDDAHHC